jgi:hypothetical protein
VKELLSSINTQTYKELQLLQYCVKVPLPVDDLLLAVGRKMWICKENVKPLPYPAKLQDFLPETRLETATRKVRLVPNLKPSITASAELQIFGVLVKRGLDLKHLPSICVWSVFRVREGKVRGGILMIPTLPEKCETFLRLR